MTTATTVLRDDPPQRATRAAGAALLLLLVLAPMQSAIWHGAAAPGWVRMMAATVAPSLVAGQGAATLPQPPDVDFSRERWCGGIAVGMSLALVLRRRGSGGCNSWHA